MQTAAWGEVPQVSLRKKEGAELPPKPAEEALAERLLPPARQLG
jgi:hypothetical protein